MSQNFASLQSWPKKFVLGCVAGAVARSRNLGQTFLANSVYGNFIVNISIATVNSVNLLPRTSLSLIFARNLTSLQKVSLITSLL